MTSAPAIKPSVINWTPITLSDTHPTTGATLTFTFPQRMVARPLTSQGIQGSQPDNTASWWPYFQARHKTTGLFWVQGHMLNHHVHGEGKPYNLVPICSVLNTNMSALVEEVVKKLVNQGKSLEYSVEAHWGGAYNSGLPGDPLKHPAAIRQSYGLIEDGGSLLWGEQFAPTYLSWEVYELDQWGNRSFVQLDNRYREPSQWQNQFPN